MTTSRTRPLVGIFARLRREVRVAKATLVFSWHGVKHGARPSMEYWRVIVQNGGTIRIGDRAFFAGIEARTMLRTVDGGVIEMGDRNYINSGVTITAITRVTIGHDAKIGANVAISDSAGHEMVSGEGIRGAPVSIGDNVWIGRAAFILPGVTIGNNSVIGAGSIVNRDVPPDSVAVGSPARVVRTLERSSRPRK